MILRPFIQCYGHNQMNKIGEAYTEKPIGHREFVLLKCCDRPDNVANLIDEAGNVVEVYTK